MTRCWGCVVLAVWAVIVLVRLVGSVLHVVHPGGNTSYLVLWKVKFTNYLFARFTSNIHELIKVHKAYITQKKCVSIRSTNKKCKWIIKKYSCHAWLFCHVVENKEFLQKILPVYKKNTCGWTEDCFKNETFLSKTFPIPFPCAAIGARIFWENCINTTTIVVQPFAKMCALAFFR